MSPRGALVYIILLAGMLPLLVFNTETQAPLRQGGSGAWPQLKAERWLAGMDQVFIHAGGGGNLALHLDRFNWSDYRQGSLACQYYFRAAYALYPDRVFIGRADRIINFPSDLAAADFVADDDWLCEHDVKTVLTLHATAGGDVVPEIRRVP